MPHKTAVFDTTIKERENIVLDTVEFGREERAYLDKQLEMWLSADRMPNNNQIAEKLFLRLIRADEYKTLERYNHECWEASLEGEETSYQLPIIEDILNIHSDDIKWPDGKRFAVCLTHDMDILHYSQIWQRLRSLKYYLRAPLKDRMTILFSTLKHALLAFKLEPDFPIDSWMRVEDQFGFRSTMFFLSGPPAAPHYYDSFYHFSDRVNYFGKNRRLKDVLPEIAAAGWDIGVHGGINSAFSSNLLSRERERLSNAAGVEVISGRQHYLFYDIRITPLVHERAGLLVDSSLGSNIHPFLYRCGTGLAHRMYDLIDKRVLNLVQVPMIVQDVPLLHTTKGYIEFAENIIFELLEATASKGTAITLSFHNNCFENDARFVLYRRVLQKAYELNAWGCSAREIYEWFHNNNQKGANY